MKKGYLDTPGGQIHYCEEGSGDALILLHQSGRSIDDFVELIPTLAQEHRVVAMDSINFGESYKTKEPPSIEDCAQSVKLLLQGLNLGKASILGHHTGALIAIEVAAADPSLVDKLILCGPPYVNQEVSQYLRGFEKESRERARIKSDGSHYLDLWKHFTKNGMGLEWASPAIISRWVLDILRAGDTGTYGQIMVSNYLKMENRLSLVKSPTLIIWGSRDFATFPSIAKHLISEGIKRSKVVELEGGSIFIMQQMPERISQIVLEFLSDPGV
ncbi:MAG: alpha/beta hydrolase [Nitrososphaerota archaeon]|nr:alpha/beta hydrolase [Nitrososphaerota archaeon]MDG6924278.1 alpha/beta hydrolase [Nitrososphaerota archaeon]